jgi:TRAP-type C4-dicarboxylate transport system substrate-binding protein
VLTLSSWVPPTHTLTESQKEWCGMLEQKTAGKVKCNQLPRAVSAPPGTFDAARMMGKGWDKVDRRGMAFMQAAGVQFTKADPAFVKAVKEKTDPLVDTWAKAAEAKGMKDPKKALADFRADIKKLER